jgi:hypothetical protein
LSSGDRTHTITIRLGWTSNEEIAIDDKTVARMADVAYKNHDLAGLSAEIGSPVTVKVSRKALRISQVESLTLSVGDQVLEYTA